MWWRKSVCCLVFPALAKASLHIAGGVMPASLRRLLIGVGLIEPVMSLQASFSSASTLWAWEDRHHTRAQYPAVDLTICGVAPHSKWRALWDCCFHCFSSFARFFVLCNWWLYYSYIGRCLMVLEGFSTPGDLYLARCLFVLMEERGDLSLGWSALRYHCS